MKSEDGAPQRQRPPFPRACGHSEPTLCAFLAPFASVLSGRLDVLGLLFPLTSAPQPECSCVPLTRALPGNRVPEGGSADLEIPASRAGSAAGAPEGGPAAAFARLEGEAAGDRAFPGGATIPPGERLQVRGSPPIRKVAPVADFAEGLLAR